MALSHKLDVYGVWLHVTTDRKQLANMRRKYGSKKVPPRGHDGEVAATVSFRIEPDDGPNQSHYLIDINIGVHRGDKRELIDTIAHEATHVSTMILDTAGAEYDGSSEPLAFLVGWITAWLYDAVVEA